MLLQSGIGLTISGIVLIFSTEILKVIPLESNAVVIIMRVETCEAVLYFIPHSTSQYRNHAGIARDSSLQGLLCKPCLKIREGKRKVV